MTKAEMAEYADKKPIAVYPMGNWGGLEVLDIIYGINDYAVVRFNFGEPDKKVHKVKIYYDRQTPHIQVDGVHVSLGECMSV